MLAFKIIVAALIVGSIGSTAIAQTKPSKSVAKQQTQSSAASGPERVESVTALVVNRLDEIADLHWHKGEYNHIVNLNRMIVAARPEDVERYADIGWLLWSMNRDSEALAFYEQGLKANPKTSFMYDEIGHFYYNRKKDYPKAIQYYEQAVKFDDVQPFTRHLLAHSYERAGQLDKSLQAWERAAQDPADPVAKRNLERVRQKMKTGTIQRP